MGGYVTGGCVSLFFLKLQKREINDKVGYLCQAWRKVIGSCDHSWWSVMVGVGGLKNGNFSVM